MLRTWSMYNMSTKHLPSTFHGHCLPFCICLQEYIPLPEAHPFCLSSAWKVAKSKIILNYLLQVTLKTWNLLLCFIFFSFFCWLWLRVMENYKRKFPLTEWNEISAKCFLTHLWGLGKGSPPIDFQLFKLRCLKVALSLVLRISSLLKSLRL